LLLAVLGSMILTVVAAAILTRRIRLLLYLIAVALWALLALIVGRFAGDVPILNIDIVLLVVLLTMTILWLVGRQVRVDGFEVVMTVIVITTLWLLPLALRLMPESLSILVVVGVVLAPGVSSILSALPRPRRRTSPSDRATLSLACLSYALLAALVWTVGGGNASFPDALASALLDYILLPLALLLILTASAGRARVAPGRRQARKFPHQRDENSP
jgi:hypothetical protein